MSKKVDAAIAFALANYAAMAEEEAKAKAAAKSETVMINLSGDKPAKVRKAKIAKQEKKAAEAPPEKVLDASTSAIFLAAIKVAGMRENEHGVKTRDFTKVLGDEKEAIRAFCGYFPSLPHGIQLDNATRRAKMLVNPSLGQNRKRVDNTVKGFVAGLPDHEEKRIQDLLARQRLAISEMQDKDSPEPVKTLAEARLIPIQEELDALGYVPENCSPPLTAKIQVSWTIDENG